MTRLTPGTGRRLPLMLQAEAGRRTSAFRRALIRFAGPGLGLLLVGGAAVSTGLLIGSSLAVIVGAWAGVYGLLLWAPRFAGSRRLRSSVPFRVRRVTAGKRYRLVLPS
jgi:membrane protein implicated in regulation of membrane protease activity